MKRTKSRTKKLSPLEVTEGRVTVTIYPRYLPSGNVQYRVDNRRLDWGIHLLQN